jgi:uncharacterized protein YfbU (UPF0304 family)
VLACALDSADTFRMKLRRKSWLLLALVSFFVSAEEFYSKFDNCEDVNKFLVALVSFFVSAEEFYSKFDNCEDVNKFLG